MRLRGEHARRLHAEQFEALRIGADVLPLLSEQDLEELGLPVGDRRPLLAAIASAGASATLPSPSPLPRPSPGRGERRELTVLFCDVVGFTELASAVDPEVLDGIVRSYEEACAACVIRYEGHVFSC